MIPRHRYVFNTLCIGKFIYNSEQTISSPTFPNVDPLTLLTDSKHTPSSKDLGFNNHASRAQSVRLLPHVHGAPLTPI